MRLPLTALLGETFGATEKNVVQNARAQIVSFVGAGGKTSLLFALAHLLVAAGERVICTTTTKLFPPTPEQCPHTVLIADSLQENRAYEELVHTVRASLERFSLLTLAHSRLIASQVFRGTCPDQARVPCLADKLLGLAPDDVMRLATALPDVRFLVEADGSAQRPLKAPATHEPVFPAGTGCCVGVIGLDCLGRTLDAVSVHRLECVLEVTGQQVGSRITPATVTRLVAHPAGLFRHCPSCRRVVFCNKADRIKRSDFPRVSDFSAAAERERARVFWFAGSARAGWCRVIPFPDRGDLA